MTDQSKDPGQHRTRKKRFHWPSEAERKLMAVWADVLTRFGGQMVAKKAKVQRASDMLLWPTQKSRYAMAWVDHLSGHPIGLLSTSIYTAIEKFVVLRV